MVIHFRNGNIPRSEHQEKRRFSPKQSTGYGVSVDSRITLLQLNAVEGIASNTTVEDHNLQWIHAGLSFYLSVNTAYLQQWNVYIRMAG